MCIYMYIYVDANVLQYQNIPVLIALLVPGRLVDSILDSSTRYSKPSHLLAGQHRTEEDEHRKV
jgi:hypothetical protein